MVPLAPLPLVPQRGEVDRPDDDPLARPRLGLREDPSGLLVRARRGAGAGLERRERAKRMREALSEAESTETG